MRPAAKVGIVVAGYVIALLAAIVVVEVYTRLTESPDRDLYSGMYAFGDGLLFLATLTLVANTGDGSDTLFPPAVPRFLYRNFASVARLHRHCDPGRDRPFYAAPAGRTDARVVGAAVAPPGARAISGVRILPYRALCAWSMAPHRALRRHDDRGRGVLVPGGKLVDRAVRMNFV